MRDSVEARENLREIEPRLRSKIDERLHRTGQRVAGYASDDEHGRVLPLPERRHASQADEGAHRSPKHQTESVHRSHDRDPEALVNARASV